MKFKYTSLAFQKHEGLSPGNSVQSKKLVAYCYCLFIPSDLPINEPVFRKVDQREKVSLLLLLSGRIFYR